jgi:hypothetical protein
MHPGRPKSEATLSARTTARRDGVSKMHRDQKRAARDRVRILWPTADLANVTVDRHYWWRQGATAPVEKLRINGARPLGPDRLTTTSGCLSLTWLSPPATP